MNKNQSNNKMTETLTKIEMEKNIHIKMNSVY